jgi:hypothetical protein
MQPRLLASLALAIFFLFGLLNCSKKGSPAPPPTNTGSYLLNGQLKTCQVAAYTSSSAGQDYLALHLTTTPQPASGPEVLYLNCVKPTGQPSSAYQALQYSLARNGTTNLIFSNPTIALTSTSNSLAGTFSAPAPYSNPAVTFSSLTAGVFTNVSL